MKAMRGQMEECNLREGKVKDPFIFSQPMGFYQIHGSSLPQALDLAIESTSLTDHLALGVIC